MPTRTLLSKTGLSKLCVIAALMLFFSSTARSQTCTVNAGVPYIMCQDEGTEWTLFGNTNDPNGDPVPVTWSVVSQPAGSNVTLVSPNSLNTLVTNVTELGDYVFRIEGVCPDGSGNPVDLVINKLAEPLPDPGLDPSYEFCGEGTISVPNPDPSISYGWVAYEFNDNNEYESGVKFTPEDSDFHVDVFRYYPGGVGKVILFSSRNGCFRRDTVDLMIMNDEVADAGDDVYICGDTWVKEPWIEEYLDATEYRFLTRGGTQSWTQLSGPQSATIDYNATYNTYSEGFVTFGNMAPGTYVFELTFTYPAPCNMVTTDTFTIYANAGVADDCQDFTRGRLFIGDCDGDLDKWIIDLKDYGIDPSQILPGDSIIWSMSGTECNFPLPEVNQLVVEVPTDGICDDCELHAYYDCNSSPGCGDAITFEFFVYDNDLVYSDIYACSEDGSPIRVSSYGPVGGSQPGACHAGSYWVYTEVIDSPLFPNGTKLSGSLVNVPFTIGTHNFEFNVTALNHYLQLGLFTGITGCQQTYPYSVIVGGTAAAANAGTDAILPCRQTVTTLSGSDPNVPSSTGSTSHWYFESGPSVPTMSDPTQLDLNVSNLIPGVYTFKYSVGNAGCGFYEDYVSIVVANAAPTAVDAGPDQNVCHGGKIYLNATDSGDAMGTWTSSPGGLTFSDVNDPNAYIEGMNPGTNYTLTWTAQNGCGSASDSVNINVSNVPGDYADAGADTCIIVTISNQVANLTANTPIAGATGTWTVIETSPPGTNYTIGDINDPTTTYWANGNYQSNHWIEWAVEVPGCDIQRDTVHVTFKGSYMNPYDDDFAYCDGPGTYALDYRSFWYGNYLWREDYDGPTGAEFLTAPGEDPALVSFTQPGEYVFYIDNGNETCGDSGEIIVYISESAGSAYAGEDRNFCDEYTLQLNATPAPYGGYWLSSTENLTNSFATLTWSDVSDPQATVTVPQAGDWTFIWVAEPDPPFGSQCLVMDTVHYFITPAAEAGTDQYYCITSEITLRGNDPGENGTGSWSFVSGPSTPTLTSSSSDGQTALYDNFTEPGTYQFAYTIDSPICPSSTDYTSVIFQDPNPDLGPDFVHCNDSLSISIPIPQNGESVEWTILSGSGSVIGSNTAFDFEVGSLINGEVITVEVAVTTVSGCTGRDEVQIEVAYFDQLSMVETALSACGATDGSLEIGGLEPNTNYNLSYLSDGVPQGPIPITTDALGRYVLSNLGAGTYDEVMFSNSSGCESESLGPTVLNSPCTQNLGDYVWYDDNANGQQDAGEAGVNGVVVTLYQDNDQDGNPDGPAINTTSTNASGYYLFPDLPSGSYVLYFDISNVGGAYGFTFQNLSNSDALDSDVNSAGYTETIQLANEIDNMDVDAGINEQCPSSDCVFVGGSK